MIKLKKKIVLKTLFSLGVLYDVSPEIKIDQVGSVSPRLSRTEHHWDRAPNTILLRNSLLRSQWVVLDDG